MARAPGRLFAALATGALLAAVAAACGAQPAATEPPPPPTAASAPEQPASATAPAGITTPTPKAAAGATARWRTDLEAGGRVGNAGPNATVTLTDGTTAALEELAGGRPLLLYFFATW